jgi:HK97 family phage major capsid protein
MAYNNLTSRTDAAALIPEQVSREMITRLEGESAAMSLFRRVPVATNQTRFPVISALPTAYFVTGDTGLKQTTEINWANVYMNVEEIAAIAPVPDSVVADALDYNIWDEMEPLLRQAVGRVLDAAIFFGTNKPTSWPSAIATAAASAGNTYTRGTNNAAAGGISEDINQLMATVEADGYDVNGFVADRPFRARLRSARDSTGQRLLDINGGVDMVEGIRVAYSMPGLWPTASGSAELFAGDFTKGLLGIRQDITIKIAQEAVIQDGTGAIVFNTFQQDMSAVRIVFRVGWVVSNPINYSQGTEASRYPFAALLKP